MNPGQILSDANAKFQAAHEHFKTELNKLRTGRASASMLDGVMIEAYGVQMPLNQVATVTAPEAQLIQISPFDPTNIQAISSAIRANQTLGLNPSDDGRVIRLSIPPLTEERRREISKQVGTKQEDCLVTMRNARRDAMTGIDQAKKDKEIGEDEADRMQKQVDEAMNKVKTEVEVAGKAKEAEIMSL